MKFKFNKKFAIITLISVLITWLALGIFLAPQAQALNLSKLNPFSGLDPTQENVVPILVGRVILAVFGITGSFALFMMVFGGFMLLTAAGVDEKIRKGKEIIIWAIIGLIVILAAYALVALVFTALQPGGGAVWT